jgi:flagellar motor switch protein FliG
MTATGDELTELLALLGADVAEAVRPHLSKESVAALRTLNGADIKTLSPRKRERLLAEFERVLQFVMVQGGATPNRAAAPRKAEAEEADLRSQLGEDPDDVLEQAPAAKFAIGLKGEHPRIIAVAVDGLPPHRVAELLGALPKEIGAEVVKELGRGIKVRDDVRSCLVEAVARKILDQPTEPPRDEDHLKRLAEVIRATDKAVRRPLIAALTEQDPDTAAQLADLLYRFEDITTLEDRAVQTILGQIDVGTLAAALAGAAPEVSEKVLKNLSRRASDMLKEELQFAGRTPAAKIEQARTAVAKLIAKTEQEAE